MKKILIALILLLVVGLFAFQTKQKVNTVVPVTEVTKEETTPIAQDNVSNLIIVESPVKNEKINSPYTITGKARGQWFFEASFPIELRDVNGNLLQTFIAQAQSDWMTENFVPFKATLTYPVQNTPTKAFLVFKKDNPSGEPQYDKSLTIEVTLQ